MTPHTKKLLPTRSSKSSIAIETETLLAMKASRVVQMYSFYRIDRNRDGRITRDEVTRSR